MGGESGSSTPGFCNSDFPKLANNATTVANAAILTKRSINATNLSFGRAGGSGTGSGLKDLIRRSRCSSSDQRGVDVEVPTDRSRLGAAGRSRTHLGAYLSSSESVPSSLPIVTLYEPLTKCEIRSKITAPGRIKRHYALSF
jgi:hypothetical protein